MAHFRIPPGAKKDDYDTSSSGEVSSMRIREGQRATIALSGGNGLTLMSENGFVVPNVRMFRTSTDPNTQIISMFGMNDGTSHIVAGKGQYGSSSWVTLLTLEVKVINVPDAHTYFIALDGPSMALNAEDTPVKLNLDVTELIPKDMSASIIIGKVKAAAAKSGGRLKHLAISSHSRASNPTDILIGKGLNPINAHLFTQLKGMVTVIWAGTCAISGPDKGKDMCRTIVRGAECYLVAAATWVPNPVKVAKGCVDVSTRCNPTVYIPPEKKWDSPGWVQTEGGEQISFEKEFLGYGVNLGFRVLT